MMRHAAWLLFVLLIFASRTLAQGGDCPAIVDAALQTAANACTALSRNQACYGNVMLQAEPQAGASFTFEQTGDMVNLVDVASLSLSAMSEDAWGVALMLLQANLPDTVPGQNVTMVLFGEVDITNAVVSEPAIVPTAVPTPVLFTVTAGSTINVRSGPSTSDAVVTSLGAGETVPTDGRNDDSTWLHVRFDDGTMGWVFAELVSVDGDTSMLPVTDGAASVATEEAPVEPTYTPMQAFYFHSSIGDSGCEEAPDSGILIQTPQGAGTINLLVNEVEITLGSTAYLTAGDGEMTVTVIEGQGTVSAFGVTVTVPAGTRAHIPLDANGVASGAPVGPEPYDSADVGALPIALLPQTVTSAPPLTEEEIAAMNQLRDGNWTMDFSFFDSCTTVRLDNEPSRPVQVQNNIFIDPDETRVDDDWVNYFIASEGLRIPGEYLGEFVTGGESNTTITLSVISSTEVTLVMVNTSQGCEWTTTSHFTADE